MEKISMDISTGFIPEDELVQLGEMPDDLTAGASTWLCGVSLVYSAVTLAYGDACPTTACTSRC